MKRRLDSPPLIYHAGWHAAHDNLHHREMFQVVVRLEQGVAREELDQDAPDREHVAGIRPGKA